MEHKSLQEQNLSNLATIGRRFVAFVIDNIITSTLFYIIFYKQLSYSTDVISNIIFLQEHIWVFLIIEVTYHTLFIANNGATMGKYLMKIKVVNEENGKLLSWKMAFVRAVVRTVGEMFFYFTFIFAFVNSKRQTLQDKLAHSVVINA